MYMKTCFTQPADQCSRIQLFTSNNNGDYRRFVSTPFYEFPWRPTSSPAQFLNNKPVFHLSLKVQRLCRDEDAWRRMSLRVLAPLDYDLSIGHNWATFEKLLPHFPIYAEVMHTISVKKYSLKFPGESKRKLLDSIYSLRWSSICFQRFRKHSGQLSDGKR